MNLRPLLLSSALFIAPACTPGSTVSSNEAIVSFQVDPREDGNCATIGALARFVDDRQGSEVMNSSGEMVSLDYTSVGTPDSGVFDADALFELSPSIEGGQKWTGFELILSPEISEGELSPDCDYRDQVGFSLAQVLKIAESTENNYASVLVDCSPVQIESPNDLGTYDQELGESCEMPYASWPQ
jgi:hypothetical protein